MDIQLHWRHSSVRNFVVEEFRRCCAARFPLVFEFVREGSASVSPSHPRESRERKASGRLRVGY